MRKVRPYTIVPKEEALNAEQYQKGWIAKVKALPLDKAGKISGLTHTQAKYQAVSLLGCLRKSRVPIKIHTRIAEDGDMFAVYFWRDEDTEENTPEG